MQSADAMEGAEKQLGVCRRTAAETALQFVLNWSNVQTEAGVEEQLLLTSRSHLGDDRRSCGRPDADGAVGVKKRRVDDGSVQAGQIVPEIETDRVRNEEGAPDADGAVEEQSGVAQRRAVLGGRGGAVREE
jgi:hypothetical protein